MTGTLTGNWLAKRQGDWSLSMAEAVNNKKLLPVYSQLQRMSRFLYRQGNCVKEGSAAAAGEQEPDKVHRACEIVGGGGWGQ